MNICWKRNRMLLFLVLNMLFLGPQTALANSAEDGKKCEKSDVAGALELKVSWAFKKMTCTYKKEKFDPPVCPKGYRLVIKEYWDICGNRAGASTRPICILKIGEVKMDVKFTDGGKRQDMCRTIQTIKKVYQCPSGSNPDFAKDVLKCKTKRGFVMWKSSS